MSDLYNKAVAVVLNDKVTENTTMAVHRRVRCGYNEAARYVERMVRDGLITEPNSLGVRTILSSLPPLRASQDGWQPIETAPRDGRYIVAGRFGPDLELKWVKHSHWITAEECAAAYGGEPEEYVAGWIDGENEEEECFPTHWQPLEAPASLRASQEKQG